MRKVLALLFCSQMAFAAASQEFEKITTDAITTPDHSSLANLTAFTLAGWFSFDDVESGFVDPLIAKGEVSGNKEYRMRFITGSNAINCHFSTTGTDEQGVSRSESFSSGEWYHIVCTWDGSTIRIYFDGEEQGSGTSRSGTMNYSGVEVAIGTYSNEGSSSNHLDGKAVDAAIYNRALSEAEINEIMRCSPLAVPRGLVYYPDLRSEEPSMRDLSGNGRTATPTGTAASSDGPPTGMCKGAL